MLMNWRNLTGNADEPGFFELGLRCHTGYGPARHISLKSVPSWNRGELGGKNAWRLGSLDIASARAL